VQGTVIKVVMVVEVISISEQKRPETANPKEVVTSLVVYEQTEKNMYDKKVRSRDDCEGV
jgi:hypothetical protein